MPRSGAVEVKTSKYHTTSDQHSENVNKVVSTKCPWLLRSSVVIAGIETCKLLIAGLIHRPAFNDARDRALLTDCV